jgi:kynureninase
MSTVDVAEPLSRAACEAADRGDPLAGFRDEFELPEGIVYLDGNSPGALPRGAGERARQVLEQQWGRDLIGSWNTHHWFELPQRIGSKIGELIGGGLIRLLGEAGSDYELRLIDDEASLDTALEDANGADVAVVMLTHVNYRTGEMWDMGDVTERVHAAGALAVWDLCHSVGAVPVDLTATGADFAVGCTYKYLNGGPGAPAFVWAAPQHLDRAEQPLSGWWGHRRPFEMSVGYQPADGAARFLAGTQPILSLATMEVGVDIALRADPGLLREKSLVLTSLFIELVERRMPDHPLTLVTPRDEAKRGSHVSFRHTEGYAVMQALIAQGVIGDYREPEVLRFGFTPLYTGYADVWDAAEALRRVLDEELWRAPEFQRRGAVT